ncbi:hypothetical protein JGH11_10455 [Dysgonomonas sp. Marseille-P4677]|uniref:hypothetical protein n=1 Tax=Dysgonomonas sp. Marseille-P4677 TaxID=2364790 RepID=UPI0019140A59|nr:hypothetical protein [Dysgonomonas sp. Marseille-P4677]MBK5721292.1 hypothetical protein [Dysgonomonas sp. Marseille-P4677]
MNEVIIKKGILFLILFFFTSVVYSQVTIGDDISPPKDYSVLEISTVNTLGGLRLPQLTTSQREALTTDAFKNDPKAQGLAIYNMTNNCFEYWNGTIWISLCGRTRKTVVSSVNTDTVEIYPSTPVGAADTTRNLYKELDTELTSFKPISFPSKYSIDNYIDNSNRYITALLPIEQSSILKTGKSVARLENIESKKLEYIENNNFKLNIISITNLNKESYK